MEAAIRRGRLLREILKQDRLAPLPAAFQMAWLVAFNDGLFGAVEPDDVPALITKLAERVRGTTLSLDSPREEWSRSVTSWLSQPARDTTT